MSAPSETATKYLDLKVTFGDSPAKHEASVHYLEAGSAKKPTILLLHGFPSSSHQFRNVIPMLADSYHVLAPDLPGFGFTKVPKEFVFAFDNLTAVISAWVQELKLSNLAVYVFDYGAPVGYRLALANPDLVKAIISQNGNAYKEGFGQDFWAPLFNLWESQNSAAARRQVQDIALNLETTKFQYVSGTPDHDLPLLDPVSYQLDYYQNVEGPANAVNQLDLFYDYRKNVDEYPAFHKYFRESKVPILAVWGKNDIIFTPPGAEAFKKDSPNAQVRFVDAGHFALETKRWEIVSIMKEWLVKISFGA